jgi:predicted phosphate transport protein (TIGR00153 family)
VVTVIESSLDFDYERRPMRLLPHDQTFFQFFEQHGAKTVEGCRALLSLIESPADLEAQSQRVAQIEQECDDITHAVVASLHKTFITPLDRNDIYRLITRMDDIMDLVEAAADRFALYEIHHTTPDVGELARALVSSAEHVRDAVSGLRDMKKAPVILQHCIEINRLENVADKILRSALARLFREEKDPIAIMKWKELYETLESATDRCEDVANVIEGVVLENS